MTKKWEYIDVTDYIIARTSNLETATVVQHFDDKETDYAHPGDKFSEAHRRMDRNAKEGYERKIYVKVNTKTHLVEKNKEDQPDGSWGNLIRERSIRLFYLGKNDKYKMLRDKRMHCVQEYANSWSAQEEYHPMTSTKRNGVWTPDPVQPAKPQSYLYYLFGVEYTKEEWESHPFKQWYNKRIAIDSYNEHKDK